MRATRPNRLASATGPRLRPAGRGAARTVRAWRPAAGEAAGGGGAGWSGACELAGHACRSRLLDSPLPCAACGRPRQRRSGGRKLRHSRRALSSPCAPATALRKLVDRNADCLEPVATTEPRLDMAIASTAVGWWAGQCGSRVDWLWSTPGPLQAALAGAGQHGGALSLAAAKALLGGSPGVDRSHTNELQGHRPSWRTVQGARQWPRGSEAPGEPWICSDSLRPILDSAE